MQSTNSSRKVSPRTDSAAMTQSSSKRVSTSIPPPPNSQQTGTSNTAQPAVHKITITPLLNLPGPRTQFRIGRDARGKWSVQEEEDAFAKKSSKSPRDRHESTGTASEAGAAAASEKELELATPTKAMPPPLFSQNSQTSKTSSASNWKSVAENLQLVARRLSEAPYLPTTVENIQREEQRAADDIVSDEHKRKYFFCSLVYFIGLALVLIAEIVAFSTGTGLYMFGMGFVCAILWLLAGLLSLRAIGVCAAALWRSRIRIWIVATAAVVFLAGVAAGFLGVLGAIGIACEANPNTRISLCGADLSSNRNTTVLNGLNTTGSYYSDTTVSLSISGVIVIDIVKFLLGVIVFVTAVVQSFYLWSSLIRSTSLCRKKQSREWTRWHESASEQVTASSTLQRQSPPDSVRGRKNGVFSISRPELEFHNSGYASTTLNILDDQQAPSST